MYLGEFDLIDRYFRRPTPQADLGVGDDCALLTPRPGMQWAVSTDLLVEGRHFVSTVPPQHLGHKALAVNLSDLAACGARPVAYTLSLSLPAVDERWLAGFAAGLHALADEHRIDLVGGDTTAGPLTIGITVMGEVPRGAALLRSGAMAGDALWVSGTLGDARLGLEVQRGTVVLEAAGYRHTRSALEQPQPRVALGLALRGVATSAIDLSDGLLGDLGHLLARSGERSGQALGARIEVERLPTSAVLGAQATALRHRCQLSGGDDYELLFTAPSTVAAAIRAAADTCGTVITCIGVITAEPGIDLRAGGERLDPSAWSSYDHFRTSGAGPER